MGQENKQAKIHQILGYLCQEQGFLIREQGFQLVHTALGGRYETDPIVGLSNGRVQLLFLGPHTPRLAFPGVPFVGLHDESREHEYVLDKYWIASTWFFCFVDGILEGKSWRDIDMNLLEKSTWHKLETRLPLVDEMFENENAMRRWIGRYVRFLIQIGKSPPLPLREWLLESES